MLGANTILPAALLGLILLCTSCVSAKIWNYPTADFKFPRVSFTSDGEWKPVTPEMKHLCTEQVQLTIHVIIIETLSLPPLY